MQIKYLPPSPARPPGLLRKSAVIIATVALAGVALMFSAVILAFLLVFIMFGGAYLWWKTRELRKRMKEQMRDFPPRDAAMRDDAFAGEAFGGEVIEGEVIHVDEFSAEGPGIDSDGARGQSR